MLASFDSHGTKVGIMTNPAFPKGAVEFSIEEQFKLGECVGRVDIPGVSEITTPVEHHLTNLTLFMSKSEARAVASALMGAAAEL